MYVLLFRIRGVYLDLIVAGEKTVEVRRYCQFWNARARQALFALGAGEAVVATFLSGKRKHSRWVNSIRSYETPEQVLRWPPSEQGAKDIGTGFVWGFHLGEELLDEHRFADLPCKLK